MEKRQTNRIRRWRDIWYEIADGCDEVKVVESLPRRA